MRKNACPREQEILQAMRSEATSEEEQQHVDACPSCRESVMVASWMQEVARTAGRATPLPDAQSIWWRSRVVKQLCEREDRIERRTRPLMLVHGIATFLVIATIVGFVLTSEAVFGVLGAVVGGSGTANGVPAALVAAVIVSLGAGAVLAWRLSSELT
jgi:hypothetical protein